MNKIQVFKNDSFGAVRTVTDDNGKILFCGSDVAKALGYSNVPDAISRHCRCIVKCDIPHPQSHNKTIEMSFITEGNVYRLTFGSKLPSAEKFTDWVADEILPTIRRRFSDSSAIIGYCFLADVEMFCKFFKGCQYPLRHIRHIFIY